MRTFVKLMLVVTLTPILIGLLLISCSSTDPPKLTDNTIFEIRNVVIYEMIDQDCAWEAINMLKGPHGILKHCPDSDRQWWFSPAYIDVPTLLLGDVWVTDEDGNTLYFNIEIYDPDNNLMAADSHYNLKLWFNGLTDFSAGFLFELRDGAAKGEYTANIWLEDNAGRTTDVFTVSIWYI